MYLILSLYTLQEYTIGKPTNNPSFKMYYAISVSSLLGESTVNGYNMQQLLYYNGHKTGLGVYTGMHDCTHVIEFRVVVEGISAV